MVNPNTERSVVITGASTGIGRGCALYMHRLGWRVFAGVRKDADAAALRAGGSERLIPISLDVTDAGSIQDAVALVKASVGERGLSGLVNNAGIPYGGPVEFLNLDEVRDAFEVNFFGAIAVTQAFLPLLRAGHGRIVNMSSVGGMVSAPFMSPYTTSKFALEALSDALRLELSPWKIRVSVIQPGAIDTPIWSKGGQVLENLLENAPEQGMELYGRAIRGMEGRLRPHGVSTGIVEKTVAHALTSAHPKTRYPIGLEGAMMKALSHLPDRWRDRLILSQFPKWG